MSRTTLAVACLLFSALPTLAQTSSVDEIRNDPRGQYQIIKAAVARYKPGARADRGGAPNNRNGYELTDCAGTEIPQSRDRLSTALMTLAFEINISSRNLSWMRYPRGVWEPIIKAYEEQGLRDIVRKGRFDADTQTSLQAEAANRLNEFQSSSKARLPMLSGPPGGGD